MRQQRFRLWIFSVLLLGGCVATTTDIDRLSDTMTKMQRSQADLVTKMDDLDRSITALGEKLTESQKKMSTLSTRLDDLQVAIGGRMESISQLLSAATTQAGVAVPGDVYRSAYQDYLAGKLDLAVSGFQAFIGRYPESDLAESAQYYLADALLARRDFGEARLAFDKVLSISRQYRAPALLKRAQALIGEKRPAADVEATIETLKKEFPNSAESQAGEALLKELHKPPMKTRANPAVSDEESSEKQVAIRPKKQPRKPPKRVR